MELDLSGIDLFDADKITFDKRKTYIYGPNGTGKTTISNQIKKMSNDYDVYVFQGFESVISSDKTLNAIVLGTENVEISQQLDKINGLIESKQKEINDIKETISEPKNQDQQNDYSLVIAPVVADLCTTPVALSAPPNSYQNNSQS